MRLHVVYSHPMKLFRKKRTPRQLTVIMSLGVLFLLTVSGVIVYSMNQTWRQKPSLGEDVYLSTNKESGQDAQVKNAASTSGAEVVNFESRIKALEQDVIYPRYHHSSSRRGDLRSDVLNKAMFDAYHKDFVRMVANNSVYLYSWGSYGEIPIPRNIVDRYAYEELTINGVSNEMMELFFYDILDSGKGGHRTTLTFANHFVRASDESGAGPDTSDLATRLLEQCYPINTNKYTHESDESYKKEIETHIKTFEGGGRIQTETCDTKTQIIEDIERTFVISPPVYRPSEIAAAERVDAYIAARIPEFNDAGEYRGAQIVIMHAYFVPSDIFAPVQQSEKQKMENDFSALQNAMIKHLVARKRPCEGMAMFGEDCL